MRRITTALLALLAISSLLVAASGTAFADERAEVTVSQPDYIDAEVSTDRAENATVYHAHGPEQTLTLENANYSNVTDVGVLDGPGTIEPNDATETFTFDPQGNEATTRVYFDVRENGATTRYIADVRVSDVAWAHVPQSKYDDQQDELSTWESVKRDAQNIAPGQDPTETIRSGLQKEGFFASPGQSLLNDMIGTVTMLFWTPGGLVIGGLILAIVVVSIAKHYRYRNRTQKQFAELEEMQREIDDAWLQKARKIIPQMSLNEMFPDHIARALRDHLGRNTWLAFKQYSLFRSPASVKGTMLQMMAQVGYVGRLEYDENGQLIEARAVKGSLEDDGDDDGESIPISDGGERTGHVETFDLSNLEYENDRAREIIEMIPADDLDERVFDEEIDISRVNFPIDNDEVSDAELIDELNPSFPGDFEDREQYARVLAELMQFVADHDTYTDDEGNVRREMDLLSFLMEMDTILHDEADFPPAYMYQKELLCAAEHMDKGERLNERVESAELDGVSSSRINLDGVGGAD
ncbi:MULTISPECIES: hypothetical protein [Halobacteriales]|uniref:Uncharacterized protein n=2 Tax=Halobacteriales TaxID=2235 RepID=A0A1I0QYN0_9EURY|nr:hypothetical protein [Natrinema salifodinae]SEW32968.1 hypothetical protein SAMN05216285_4179 [Natrinema salifodinae]